MSLIIGIDPGTVTGYAVIDKEQSMIIDCGGLSFWEFVVVIPDYYQPIDDGGDVELVVIEDSRNLPIYSTRSNLKGRARDKMCRAVGMIDRDITLLEVFFVSLGYNVLLQKPIKGGKWDAKKLRQFTGYDKQTNQHARDAIRLAWLHESRNALLLN